MSDSTAPDASVLAPNLSLALERITDGFFALDANWHIAYMNAEARKLLDAPGEILGRFWLDAFPKARGRLFEREYHRAMSAQMPVQFVGGSEAMMTGALARIAVSEPKSKTMVLSGVGFLPAEIRDRDVPIWNTRNLRDSPGAWRSYATDCECSFLRVRS